MEILNFVLLVAAIIFVAFYVMPFIFVAVLFVVGLIGAALAGLFNAIFGDDKKG